MTQGWYGVKPTRILLGLSAAAIAVAACSPAGAQATRSSGPYVARTRPPAAWVSVLTGGHATLTADVANKLYAFAPVAIVANSGSHQALTAAMHQAERLHAPMLLASERSGTVQLGAAVRTELRQLRPQAVLALGLSSSALAAKLHGLAVVANPSQLPRTKAAKPLRTVALLVRTSKPSAEVDASTATARAAGARVIFVRADDPRADPKTITALAKIKPDHVLALGRGFGPASQLAGRVTVAETGVQLPGGGEVLFPMHRIVCLYGHPDSAVLGALGEQDLSASIERVKNLAALYRPLSKVPVVPAFEIIASVAQGTSEPEGGTYSYVTPPDELEPWVTAATAAGMYVVLDLQAGRASLLDQAKEYQGLLERPNVGLALDPEWKLTSSQLPLEQIGSVSSAKINQVTSWLAKLTASHHLPQKLVVLHQFRLSMITDEQGIDTQHDDLAIVIHMDGQGTPGAKEETWDAVLGAAPKGVYLGWKNFFTKDHPTLTPAETMDRKPQPVMISYQ